MPLLSNTQKDILLTQNIFKTIVFIYKSFIRVLSIDY